MNVLELRDLSITYRCSKTAAKNISFTVQEGEVLAIVGESGSGKSTLIRSIIGLLSTEGHISSGEILFCGQNMQQMSKEQLRRIRGEEMAMIFQNAGEYMNPRRKIGSQYMEVLKYHRPASKEENRNKAIMMLSKLKLPDPVRIMNSYPFQLSGGMKQRVAIAMAMSMEPKLLLADEPTSALDVTVQAQVVNEMLNMRREIGTAIIMVTHNMGVASHMADYIMVMQNGELKEFGTKEQVIERPEDDYTKHLLSVVPELEGEAVGP